MFLVQIFHTYSIDNVTFIIYNSNGFEEATKNKDNITHIIIRGNVSVIPLNAFAGWTLLLSNEIGNNVIIISVNSFERCNSLLIVVIAKNITTIGNYAFSYCSSLTNIEIPSSVTSIGDYAFRFCSNLTCIYYYGDQEPDFGSYVFEYI